MQSQLGQEEPGTRFPLEEPTGGGMSRPAPCVPVTSWEQPTESVALARALSVGVDCGGRQWGLAGHTLSKAGLNSLFSRRPSNPGLRLGSACLQVLNEGLPAQPDTRPPICPTRGLWEGRCMN